MKIRLRGKQVTKQGMAIASQADLGLPAKTWAGTLLQVSLILPCLLAGPALGQLPEAQLPEHQMETAYCPPSDLSALVDQLMLDLPSYSNRVIQRASSLGNSSSLYLLLAGQAEIRPLSVGALADDPHRSRLPMEETGNGATAEEELYQVFFTTLERQYLRSPARLAKPLPAPASARVGQVPQQGVEPMLQQAAPSLQQFHWLILGRHLDEAGAPWQIISLRSQLAPYPAQGQLLAPVRSSRQGTVGQGVALWLRDFHRGTMTQTVETLNGNSATVPPLHCPSP